MQGADRGCRINGNVGRDDSRIYHVPGRQYYHRTRIDTARGERWFGERQHEVLVEASGLAKVDVLDAGRVTQPGAPEPVGEFA